MLFEHIKTSIMHVDIQYSQMPTPFVIYIEHNNSISDRIKVWYNIYIYVTVNMLTFGYIDGIHVTIYSSTMDPMGICSRRCCHVAVSLVVAALALMLLGSAEAFRRMHSARDVGPKKGVGFNRRSMDWFKGNSTGNHGFYH